ncbi:MAG: 50S ribosomal protein L11 methyltransferase [Proteobacteria bacterium]|nr:50S ribosomal protein L11 methyltransferase [Pseudomonadota bacterium]
MNLGQLECLLDLSMAEDLSSFLEDEDISITWYEKESDKWIFQVICDSVLESSLKAKMVSFFKERGLSVPDIKGGLLPQKDWVSAVYRDSPPLTIGKFYIYGSHIQKDVPSGHLPLQIDAATAFGSGQHESTEGCLKALSLLSEQQSFTHPLDMGCGSGILALAMARLWKVRVLACDNDPEAVRVTTENAQINHLETLIEASVSEGFKDIREENFDIITANILAGPLCQMAGDAVQVLRPGGFIVLAGLLNRQAEDVIDSYRSVGARLVDQLFIGDWSTLIMRK